MKKILSICIAVLMTFIILQSKVVSVEAFRPEYFAPRFNNIEELVEWIEIEDAENFQSGRYKDCLLATRNRGEIFFPFSNDYNMEISGIIALHQANFDNLNMAGYMNLSFHFRSPAGLISASIREIPPKFFAIYETEGILGLFMAQRNGVVSGSYLISERIITIRDSNISEFIEKNIPYIVNFGIGVDGQATLITFVIDGIMFNISYRDELAVDFINSLVWDRVVINPSAPTRPSTTINNPPVTQRPTAIDHFPTTPPTTTIPPTTPPNEVAPTRRTVRFAIGNNNYTINGISHTNDVAPFIDVAHGRTMVPLRAVIEAFDAEVEWNPTARTVQIFTDTGVHQLTIDTPLPGGMGVPVIREERVFVPLSYVAGLLGAYPRWDNANLAAYIYQDVTN